MKLSKEDGDIRDNLYLYYKNLPELSLTYLAKLINRDRTALGKYYKEKFGQAHLDLVKLKNKLRARSLSEESIAKLSKKLKGRKKPLRSEQHKRNLSLAFKGRTYKDRFGDRADVIKDKIRHSNLGKKRIFKNKELWRKNLCASLKGRTVWNKGLVGVTKAWNKINLPEKEIIDFYVNQNKSSVKIAKLYGISRYPILRILKENGIKMKTSSDFIKGKTLIELYGPIKAAEMKLKFLKQRLSFVDCIGYILAKKNNAKFLTGDERFRHKENVEFVK